MSKTSSLSPRKSGPKLSEGQRRAIVSLVASGRTQVSVAQEFDVNINTVRSLVKSVKEVLPTVQDWATEHRQLAVEAVNDGLRCTDDPYKRMDGGIKVLTGLQVYRPAVDVSHSVNLTRDLPSDWRGKWITAYDDDDVSPNASAGESDTSPKP